MQFTIVDSFTSTPFAGNPAAVILLPPNNVYTTPLFQNIALEFNLSETAFVTPLFALDTSHSLANKAHNNPPTFAIRWFTPTEEAPICAHATLACAAVIFESTDLIPSGTLEIRFISPSAGTLVARKPLMESTRESSRSSMTFELEFPPGYVVEADTEVTKKVQEMFRRSIEDSVDEGANLELRFVGVDVRPPYDSYVLLEVDPSLDLAELKVNPETLGALFPPYGIAVISQRATGTKYIRTRVFSSTTGTPEDPVTGSACSFAAKYWMESEGIKPGESMYVNQVSSRGGHVEVVFESDGEVEIVRLRGECRFAARGEIYV